MDELLDQLQKKEISIEEYGKAYKKLSDSQTLLLMGLVDNNNNNKRDMNELLSGSDNDQNDNDDDNDIQMIEMD